MTTSEAKRNEPFLSENKDVNQRKTTVTINAKNEKAKSDKCDFIKTQCKSVFVLVIAVLSLLDFWSDLLLGITYAKQSETVFAFFTILFTLVPTIGGAVYTVRFFRRNQSLLSSVPDKIAFGLCFVLQTHFIVPIWYFQGRFSTKKESDEKRHDKERVSIASEEEKDGKKSEENKKFTKVEERLKMFNTCEALPQLAFQFSILLGKQGFATYLQFFSIFISFVTGSYNLTSLLSVQGGMTKVLLGLANFCWVLPTSIIIGILAYDAKTVSYIASIVKLFIIIGLNMLYLRRMQTSSNSSLKDLVKMKSWSDWLKSLVYSMFVPFYMFSRIGAYVITLVLCLQTVLAPMIIAILQDGNPPKRDSHNITDFCTKCGNKSDASIRGFFDILFDSEQRVDMETLFDLAFSTVFMILILLGAILSLILLGCCCCCCSGRKPLIDIQGERKSTGSKTGDESV